MVVPLPAIIPDDPPVEIKPDDPSICIKLLGAGESTLENVKYAHNQQENTHIYINN